MSFESFGRLQINQSDSFERDAEAAYQRFLQ